MSTLVYAYGCAPNTPICEEVDEQLHLAHEFYNKLVELEIRHENALDAMWREYPDIASMMDQIDTTDLIITELKKRGKAERVENVSTVTSEPLALELKRAKRGQKETRAALRTAKNRIKEDVALPKKHLLAEHQARAKAARIDFAHRGLYWGTYNRVWADMKVAVEGVIRKRTGGEPARLHFRRWDGTGTLAVQLQRQDGDPPRDPQGLAEGTTKWRNVFSVAPWMPPAEFDSMTRPAQLRIAEQGRVRMNVGASRVVKIPVLVHRMLPPDADVLGASLTVTRVAGRRRASVSVIVNLPDAAPVGDDGPRVSVTLGWSSVPHGIQVAKLSADRPLRIPADIADLVHRGPDPHTTEITVPAAWCNRLDSAMGLQSRRDTALDAIRSELVEYLRAHPDTSDRPITTTEVARWKAPARFAAVALRWRNNPPLPHGKMIAATLEAWRRTDRRRWEAETHTRRRALGCRRDGYRRVAAWLARECSEVTMSSTDLSKLAHRTEVGASASNAVPEEVAQLARQQRVLVAPSELRESIVAACRREGVSVASGAVRAPVSENARSA